MSELILEIKNATKSISNGMDEVNTILNQVSMTVKKGEFITILGGNGAGKSTLFNSIAGNLRLDKGKIILGGKDITSLKEEVRASFIGRVFQDPKMGTAPRMTVAENLLLALYRGQQRGLKPRGIKQHEEEFRNLCSLIGNGLENHLETPAGNLSGGQRQALSLLMATMTKPELLLLDEHTAALDPKTSRQLMAFTNERIQLSNLTCLMITHRMEDALKYGNRLILLQKGAVKLDLDQKEKEKLTLHDLLLFFEENETDEISI